MNHIVFIGMPGCGKSTIARALTSRIPFRYVDGDAEIERRTREPLSATLSRLGADGFLRLEEETILSLPLEGTVFAPGGSAVYSARAMAHMKQDALTVYLRVPLETLEKRVGPLDARGVVIRSGKSFADLYCERAPLYMRYADLTLETKDLTVDEVLEQLLPHLKPLGIARS